MIRGGQAELARRSWTVVLAGAALVVAAAVGAYLVFQPDAATSSGVVDRLAGVLYRYGVVPYARAAYVAEFGLNIALFVPGALAAALLWPRVRWWRWVLVGLAVSAGVEIVQVSLLPGRVGEARDLVANTLGAALGAGVVLLLRRKALRNTARTPGATHPVGCQTGDVNNDRWRA